MEARRERGRRSCDGRMVGSSTVGDGREVTIGVSMFYVEGEIFAYIATFCEESIRLLHVWIRVILVQTTLIQGAGVFVPGSWARQNARVLNFP